MSKYRSKLEERVAKELGVEANYESLSIHYIKPSSDHFYCPDFILPNGVVLETKGYPFTSKDRAKHLLVREQNPAFDIRFVFENETLPIRKGSKTTYAMWADKNGFKWCVAGKIPKSWRK